MPEPRACREQVLLAGPRSSGPETDTRSILVHFNYCKNWRAPGQRQAPVGDGGSDKVLSFSKAGALNKCVWHRTERSSGLSPRALPFQSSGFVLLSCSVWEVGSGTDGPYFVLCTSLQSLPNLSNFYALLKKKYQKAQESNITEAFGKSCLMLCHGIHAWAETADLPRVSFWWVSGEAAHPSGAPGFPALSSLDQAVPKPLFSVLKLCGFCAGIMSKPWKKY